MKRCIYFICVLVGVSSALAASDYHDFSDNKGRTIRGKILRYDSRKKVVTIQRENRRMGTIPLGVLSDKDQAFVRQWEFNKVFFSDSSFKIEAKRKMMDREVSSSGEDYWTGYSIRNRKVEHMGYEITLENRSASKLENLSLDYCIYYEQEELRGGRQKTLEGVRHESVDIGTLRPKSEKELLTKPVNIYTAELDADWSYTSGAKNKQDGDVRGVWIQVHMDLKSGERITRSYCLPDSLPNSKTWSASSRAVGMNSASK